MRFDLVELNDIAYVFSPLIIMTMLYMTIVFFRKKPLGLEYHIAYSLALTCLLGFLTYGLSIIQNGKLGFYIWSWAGVPAAAIAFIIGWSIGIITLKFKPTKPNENTRYTETKSESIKAYKLPLATFILMLAIFSVPIDYLIRKDTPRWWGAGGTVTVNSQWYAMTMRALYPYDWNENYVTKFSMLFPPDNHNYHSPTLSHTDKTGNRVFRFDSKLPDLIVASEYSVYEYRSGKWVRYQGKITPQQFQKFIRSPLTSHSIEQLDSFLNK